MPDIWRALSSQRFLSPDGACHSFDSQANGYGRGEGMGVVIVKPLADAIRDNDVIRAVIRVSNYPSNCLTYMYRSGSNFSSTPVIPPLCVQGTRV